MLIYPTLKMAPIQGLTGFGGGATGNLVSGGAEEKNINLQIPGKWGSNSQSAGYGNYEGASVSTYWANATKNGYYGNGVTNEFEESDFTRVGDGILKFSLPAATYKIYGRSGDGSGNSHWKGMAANATLTLPSATDMLLLVPNHGAGNYAGGGGLFLIAGTDYSSSSNTALFILGGGGGGYMAGYTNTFGQPGALSTSLSQSRRGPSTGTNGNYDGAGGWLNSYSTEWYGGATYQSQRVLHFVDGGRGGFTSPCSHPGGFGGGGGGCPGAGGGLQGGYPGTDTHNGGTGYGGSGSGSYHGGGGGTSYYNSSYVSSVTTTDVGSGDNTVFTSETSGASGFFGIFTVI